MALGSQKVKHLGYNQLEPFLHLEEETTEKRKNKDLKTKDSNWWTTSLINIILFLKQLDYVKQFVLSTIKYFSYL